MCTAITYKTKDAYFGRNLDLEYSYKETVTVTPRNYPFVFRRAGKCGHHYAMIGMAYVVGGHPLYYDAVNEYGLAMAGLNFPGNAAYYAEAEGKDNITPFEFIPWLLGRCKTIGDVREALSRINLLNEQFSPELPLSPLHWIISDKHESITVEPLSDGMKIYDNPVGVLTNNPTFDYMMLNLAGYRDITAEPSQNRLSDKIDLPTYCVGMGAVGLPGDWSSASRFVKASFAKLNAVSGESEEESVGQFFHLLSTVEMPRGAVHMHDDVYDITVYSSCMNQNKGIYYYTTYNNRRISAVDMRREDLDGNVPVSYPIIQTESIHYHN